MKVIYLASGEAELIGNITYNDFIVERDIKSCMLKVDLNEYDLLVASPPCNYWSRANYRRETSVYAQETKHLLPEIINKLSKLGKPFIVENVINKVLMREIIDNFDFKYFEHGRHSYFTNSDFNYKDVVQIPEDVQYTSPKKRQGGHNVNAVFQAFIDYESGLYRPKTIEELETYIKEKRKQLDNDK